jgi:hypothetical protein
MARRRRVLLLAVAAVAFLTATSGYTAVTGDRAVGVGVVGDDDAYVGFVDAEPTATAGGEDRQTILEVQNRFGAAVSVRVTADNSGLSVDLSPPDHRLSVDSGETVSVEGTVACDESVDAPVSVTVPVTLSVDSDTGVHAEIDREVTVRCEPPQTETESDADAIAEETEGGAESDGLNNETESDDDRTDDEETDDEEESDDEETDDEEESDDEETDDEEESDDEETDDGETEDEDESDDRTDQTEA